MRISILLPLLALTAVGATAATPAPEAMPASSAAQSAPAPASEAAATPAPAAQPTQAEIVASKVQAEWAKYDEGAKGHLSRAEFGKWMGDLRSAANQPAPDTAWLKKAFAQADVDKDAKLTASELTSFLSAA